MDDEVVDTQELTFAQLFEKLLIMDDMILEDITPLDFNRIRKGLSSYKTKLNAKLKAKDLPTEERKIEFEELATNENTGLLKVRVFFNTPVTIKARIIQSDGELK